MPAENRELHHELGIEDKTLARRDVVHGRNVPFGYSGRS